MQRESHSTTDATPRLGKPRLLELFRQMLLIRRCEEQLVRSHQRGLVHGACHYLRRTGSNRRRRLVPICTKTTSSSVATAATVMLWPRSAFHPSSYWPDALMAAETRSCSHGRGGEACICSPPSKA